MILSSPRGVLSTASKLFAMELVSDAGCLSPRPPGTGRIPIRSLQRSGKPGKRNKEQSKRKKTGGPPDHRIHKWGLFCVLGAAYPGWTGSADCWYMFLG